MVQTTTTLINVTGAYNTLVNGSTIEASWLTYTGIMGGWIFFVLYLFTITIAYMRTKEPTYVTLLTILATICYGAIISLTDPMRALTDRVLWIFLILSLATTFYLFWGSKKYE